MPTTETFHVMFDGEPEVVGHVCVAHLAFGQSLGCPDARSDGDCEHVQTAPCDCAEPVRCDGCVGFVKRDTATGRFFE